MANPFPFVAGTVLTASELNGIGEYTAYTPTITNFTLGNGTSSFAFATVNKLVFVKGIITFGSTTAFTGTPLFTFPVTASSQYSGENFLGNSYILDSGTAAYAGTCIAKSTTTFGITPTNVAGTYASQSAITSIVPMTWTTNDFIRFTFVYEAA